MAQIDPRVDTYIVKSAPFAIPVLEYLRAIVHANCPEVKESIKWSFPHFEYKESILCSMASFKQHCAFGFWLGSQLTDPQGVLSAGIDKNAMGNLGRITSIDELPAEEYLGSLIEEAMALIDRGVKVKNAGGVSKEKKELVVPDYFQEALAANPTALNQFNAFSPSNKRAYVEWLDEAKTVSTREKRVETAIEWIMEGKSRHWKYEKK